jgi:type II secretory pathway pseudopilin PulG
MKREKAGKSERGNKMQLATSMNIGKVMDEEAKRERFASWYITLPGIPEYEKEMIEKSLKYNVWKELITLFVIYMILSLTWFFGAGLYDPFQSITGYKLTGKKNVIAVVQEDGQSLRLKDPNKGEHVQYTLAELGMDPVQYSYGNRLLTNSKRKETKRMISVEGLKVEFGVYLAERMENETRVLLPEKQVSKIEGLYYGVIGVGYFTILIGGISVFFIRRKRYTGWFPRFYDRLEKFYSEHAVWRKYSVEEGYDTIDAIIAYGNKNQPSFVKEFSCTRLTREDEKKKKSKIIAVWLTTIAGMTGIVLIISLQVSIASEIEQRKNEARTAAVLEKLQAAINGKRSGPDDGSEDYNYADMIDRARNTFPEEDVYYKLLTTEEYVSLIVTTKKKQNVCFDRYVPVHGSIGEEGTEYKLEISMVSDAIQPDDILHNYTGILLSTIP